MIDWTRISALEDELGQDEMPAIVSVFLEEVGEALDGLAAPTEADMHFIKGSAATLGLADLTRISSEGEIRLRQNPLAEIAVGELHRAFEIEKRELLTKFPCLET